MSWTSTCNNVASLQWHHRLANPCYFIMVVVLYIVLFCFFIAGKRNAEIQQKSNIVAPDLSSDLQSLHKPQLIDIWREWSCLAFIIYILCWGWTDVTSALNCCTILFCMFSSHVRFIWHNITWLLFSPTGMSFPTVTLHIHCCPVSPCDLHMNVIF